MPIFAATGGGMAGAVTTLAGIWLTTWVTAALPPRWATVVPSLVKIRSDSPMEGAPRASLSLAQGECEGFQVLTSPEVQDRAELTLESLSPESQTLELRGYRVGFIHVTRPSNQEGATGWWADPLLPLDARPPLTPPRQAFYVEACAPTQQAPGLYSGALSVSTEGKLPVRIPIDIEVQPFQIPATSSLPNSFGISLYSIAAGHKVPADSPEAQQLLHAYLRELLSHRVSAHGMSMTPPSTMVFGNQLRVNFDAYDREVAPYLDGTALPSGARFTSLDFRDAPKTLRTAELRSAYRQAFRDHFKKKGWDVQLFFYAKDEPKPADAELVAEQSKTMRAARVPVLITTADDALFTPAADILTPPLNCFFPRSGPATCPSVRTIQQLRSKVRGSIWWYQSCNAHGCQNDDTAPPEVRRAYSGWPSYMIDHPATLNRAMGPLAFVTRVDGELYFDTVYAFNKDNPWTEVFQFGGNGDGTFFYPGTPEALGGLPHQPVPSIRLKHLRDGLEDYEYLKALSQKGPWALRVVRSIIPSGAHISRDPSVWARMRAELTRQLRDRADNGLGTGRKHSSK